MRKRTNSVRQCAAARQLILIYVCLSACSCWQGLYGGGCDLARFPTNFRRLFTASRLSCSSLAKRQKWFFVLCFWSPTELILIALSSGLASKANTSFGSLPGTRAISKLKFCNPLPRLLINYRFGSQTCFNPPFKKKKHSLGTQIKYVA